MRNYGLSFIMLGLFLNGCQSMPDQRVMAVNAGIQSKHCYNRHQ
jgi:NTE family protein